MRNKKYIFNLVFIAFTLLGWSQEAVLCSMNNSSLKIENSADIPFVTSNSDNTITLTFAQQYITDVFSNFVIYEFYQAFPNSSNEEVLKLYNVTYNSKTLIEDVLTNIPNSVIQISSLGNDIYALPMKTSISIGLVEALDGNSYDITKYVSTADTHPCNNNPNCELYEAPNDFNFRVNFNYDAENELLNMESESLTSCGNAFSIALTGGNPNEFGETNNTLQLWDTTLGTSTISEFSQPCHNIESTIFALLDIACPSYNYAYGNISVTFDSENETIRFRRANGVFGYHIIELSEASLSIEEEVFKKIKPFQVEGNPYLQLTSLDNQTINIEIYNTSGQEIIKPTKFKENSLNLSNLSSGLYFIKLSNLNNHQKVFKFLKN